MTEYRYLATRRDGSVEYLLLNRPDVRNAFNGDLIAELSARADLIAQDPTVRAVVIGGAGKTFCAGADVAWMANTIRYTEEQNIADATATSSMFAAIDTLPVPVIGRIQGAALGGGAGLAAVCDIVVAEDRAVFGFTEVKLGIIPAVISPFVLAKIGRSAARELFLTGARFSAVRAREIGLVHAVVAADELDDAVESYLREILNSGQEAIAAAKQLIRDVWPEARERATLMTARALAERRVSKEGQEGLHAFLERRTPGWSGE